MSLPPYVLITPAHNEERHLSGLIESVTAQRVLPLRWVIVNDGSSDQTGPIAREAASQHSWITVIDAPERADRNFAAKVFSFNLGLEAVQDLDYEIVGNLDADISFEGDFFEFLLQRFVEIPELGVAGTPFHEPGGYYSAVNSFEGRNHVSGQCQLFRKTCFEDIGGYVPNYAGGIDTIAVMTARVKGWVTRSFREKSFMHHRPLGTAERSSFESAFSYGEKDYYLGNHPVWQLFRVCYRMLRSPKGAIAIGAGYAWAAIRRIERPVTPELIRFHRAEQMAKLRSIFRDLLRLRKPDNFGTLDATR